VVLSSSSPSGTGHALPHFTTMSTLSLRAFAQSMNASLHIFCLSTCALSTSSTFSHAVSAAVFKASTSPNIAHILSASALVIARKPVLNASAASLHPVIFAIVSLSMPPSQAVSMAALQAFSFVRVSLKFVPFPESLLWQSPLTPSTSAITPSKSAFFSFFFFVMPDLSKALADILKIFLALFPYHHPITDIFSRHSSVTAQAASCLPLILLLFLPGLTGFLFFLLFFLPFFALLLFFFGLLSPFFFFPPPFFFPVLFLLLLTFLVFFFGLLAPTFFFPSPFFFPPPFFFPDFPLLLFFDGLLFFFFLPFRLFLLGLFFLFLFFFFFFSSPFRLASLIVLVRVRSAADRASC